MFSIKPYTSLPRTAIFVISAFVLLCSCENKNELTREKAKKLITEYYEYPIIEIGSLYKTVEEKKVSEYDNLRSDGLIEFEDKVLKHGSVGPYYTHKINLTKEGEKYLYSADSYRDYNMVTYMLEFNEILGMQVFDAFKKADVEFTIRKTNVTPFGKFLGNKEGDLIKQSISLLLYDDGWRTDEKKPSTIRLEHVRCYPIESILHFKRAIDSNPDDEEQYYNLANSYYNTGDADNAINTYNQALHLIKEKKAQAVCYYKIGLCYGKIKNELDNAIKNISHAIELDPENVTFLEDLGVAYGINKDYQSAVNTFERITQLNPKYAKGFYNLAITYRQLGQEDRALEYFAKAKKLDSRLEY